jgi:hypothetical protein
LSCHHHPLPQQPELHSLRYYTAGDEVLLGRFVRILLRQLVQELLKAICLAVPPRRCTGPPFGLATSGVLALLAPVLLGEAANQGLGAIPGGKWLSTRKRVGRCPPGPGPNLASAAACLGLLGRNPARS